MLVGHKILDMGCKNEAPLIIPHFGFLCCMGGVGNNSDTEPESSENCCDTALKVPRAMFPDAWPHNGQS